MKRGVLLIRADATVRSGTGHVMRCLALAQAWQDAGGRAIFAMAESTQSIEGRLRREGFDVAPVAGPVGSAADAEATAFLAQQQGSLWVVVDGYQFGAEYQSALMDRRLKVLFIDDNGHARHYSADLVLNQNAHAEESLYSTRDASTRLLLGPRFALLRDEFKPWREWRRDIPPLARRVLVTMGGSDPNNVTERVVDAILSAGDFEVTIVAGGSNPHLSALRELVGSFSRAVRLVENTSSMPKLLAEADVAVAGAGTTTWEMCFLGLPALLIIVADNQQGVAGELGKRGIMVNLGDASGVSQDTIATHLRSLAQSPRVRQEMSARERDLVDGRGAERVVCELRAEFKDELEDGFKNKDLSIRIAKDGDCKLLWEWANDPEVRASAFSSASISWDDHVAWFREKLTDENCRILIAIDAAGIAVGQMRLDKRDVGDADVDISVDSRFRGLGYASHLIELGANWAFAEWDIKSLNAFVKPGNVASAKAFERAGFKPRATVIVKGHTATHYVRTAK